MDDRNKKKQAAAHRVPGEAGEGPATPPVDLAGSLNQILQSAAAALEHCYQDLLQPGPHAPQAAAEAALEGMLEGFFRDFKPFIPYHRMCVALLAERGKTLRAVWVQSERPARQLAAGFSAEMAGSSLAEVLDRREPRLLNDLMAYLAKKPGSLSTRLLVDEGCRSSLTCPLVAQGTALGFIFFSSPQLNAYTVTHANALQQIAEPLAHLVEKGRLVTELAQRSRLLEQQNQELQPLRHLKDFFLGKAVHDLRNPIANLQLTSDVMMGDGGLPLSAEEVQGFVRDLNQQARYLSDLINDIMAVAELEVGPACAAPVDFGVAGFLQESVRRCQKMAALKRIQVVVEPEAAGTARGDPQRLRQVIDNLLSNAIKYSPLGSLVRVSAAPQGSGWRFWVTDQGPGILEKDRPRLFSDFGRLSSRATAGERSTGLGLAIARRVIAAHGGKIGLEPAAGLGTTFWFEIP